MIPSESPPERVRLLLARARKRRVLWRLALGLAAMLPILLILAVASAWIANERGFAPELVYGLGITFYSTASLCTAGVGIASARAGASPRLVRALERRVASLEQSLSAYVDGLAGTPRNPLLWLLASDVEQRIARAPNGLPWPVWRSVAIACAASVVLSGAGIALHELPFVRAGIPRLLALGRGFVPPSFSVEASAAVVLQGTPVELLATPLRFAPAQVSLELGPEGGGSLEQAEMVARPDGRFGFRIASPQESFRFRVQAADVGSEWALVRVMPRPRLERARIRVVPPEWTGRPARELDGLTDLRVLDGTVVELKLESSAPVSAARIVLTPPASPVAQQSSTTEGSALKPVELEARDGSLKGRLRIDAATSYQIVAESVGQRFELSPTYTIELLEDRAPELEIAKPGRDRRATPIEEVSIRVSARDDFRLASLELLYAVNGNAPKRLRLAAGDPEAELGGEHAVEREVVLPLEELASGALEPGDVISYYAAAEDRRERVETALYFIQVRPFDLGYLQSQQSSNGGGGGDVGDLSRRQRELVSATWNLERRNADPGGADLSAEERRDRIQLLTRMQLRLEQQTEVLEQRLQARGAGSGDIDSRKVMQELAAAREAMQRAHEELRRERLESALAHEREALQRLLRVEAQARERQVSMQASSQPGQDSFSEDLSELIELEMDPEKNVYEVADQVDAKTDPHDAGLEAELEELRRLAEREQRLAEDLGRQQQPTTAQRWEQESLERDLASLERSLRQRNGPDASALARALQNARQRSARAGATRNVPAAPGLSAASEALRLAERRSREARQRALEQIPERADRLVREQRESSSELRDWVKQELPELDRERRFFGGASEREQEFAEQRRSLRDRVVELDLDAQVMVADLADASPEASAALERALGEMRESHLRDRMATAEDFIERGEGLYVVSMDERISSALEKFRDATSEAAAILRAEASEAPELAPEADLVERARRLRQTFSRRASGVSDAPEVTPSERERALDALWERVRGRDLPSSLLERGERLTGTAPAFDSEQLRSAEAVLFLEELELALRGRNRPDGEAASTPSGPGASVRSDALLEDYLMRLSREGEDAR